MSKLPETHEYIQKSLDTLSVVTDTENATTDLDHHTLPTLDPPGIEVANRDLPDELSKMQTADGQCDTDPTLAQMTSEENSPAITGGREVIGSMSAATDTKSSTNDLDHDKAEILDPSATKVVDKNQEDKSSKKLPEGTQYRSDLELAQAAVNYDVSAQTKVFNLCYAKIFRTVRHMLNNRRPLADVEDVTQETYVVLVTSLGAYRGEASLVQFACGIARNQAKQFLNRSGRNKDCPAPGEKEPVNYAHHYITRYFLELEIEDREQLNLLLERLPHRLNLKEKNCFAFHFIDGLSIAETAAAMAIQPGHVSVVKNAIRRKAFELNEILLQIRKLPPQK